MASLLLILSELVRPESANLLAVNYVLGSISPTSKDQYRPNNAASAFERARGVARRLAKASSSSSASEGDDCEVFDEDLNELKISVESVWP